MTDRLAEIAARCAAATPGPWKLWGSSICAEARHATDPQMARIAQVYSDGPSIPDAYFIAAARADVPWLIETVESLWRVEAAADKLLRWIDDETSGGQDGAAWTDPEGHLIVELRRALAPPASPAQDPGDVGGETNSSDTTELPLPVASSPSPLSPAVERVIDAARNLANYVLAKHYMDAESSTAAGHLIAALDAARKEKQ